MRTQQVLVAAMSTLLPLVSAVACVAGGPADQGTYLLSLLAFHHRIAFLRSLPSQPSPALTKTKQSLKHTTAAWA